MCCPDYGYDDDEVEDDDGVDRCVHGIARHECSECQICEHGNVRSQCYDCSMCEHGMRRCDCSHCGTCVHGIQRSDCPDCQICPHGIAKCECVPCNTITESVTETHVHVVTDDLPAPWVQYVDQDSGQPYYYNTLTGETRWTRPGASAADFKPSLDHANEMETNAAYKWSAGAGRRIHMTDEERTAHAQGARREDTQHWNSQFKRQNSAYEARGSTLQEF